VAVHADDDELPNALGSSYLMLGRIAANQGHTEEALQHFRKAVELREKLNRERPDNAILMRNLLMTYSRLGDLLGAPFQENALGDSPQALEYYRKSAAIAERLQQHDPNDRLARVDLAMTQMRIGAVLDAPAERTESLATLRRSVKIFEETPQGAKGARERGNLALAYEYIGRRLEPSDPQAALASYRRSLQIVEETPGAASDPNLRAQTLSAWRSIAGVSASTGDRDGALAAANKSVALAESYETGATAAVKMQHQVAKSQFARGLVYEALARKDGSMPQRAADWAAAKESFEHSRELAEASSHIAECDRGLLSASRR
jgi:tetratricopeptide (TPR) repeat protein